jgi:hypothetical protein
MFRDDYIIRMINQAVQALLGIAGLKKAGNYQEAQQAIDQALEQLLGLEASLVRQLDDEGLFAAITENGKLDYERLAVIADLFREDGDILAAQGQALKSRESYLRSLVYHLEAGFDEAGQPSSELSLEIEDLLCKSGLPDLPDNLLWNLFCYYERSGALQKAEQALLELYRRPNLKPGIHPELVDFYTRLLERPSAELAQAGFSRKEIQARLKKASLPDQITRRLPSTSPPPSSEQPTSRLSPTRPGAPN